MFGKILSFLKLWLLPQENKQFDLDVHKICEDCQGSGIDDPLTTCLTCGGEGMVEKTRKEMFNSLWEN